VPAADGSFRLSFAEVELFSDQITQAVFDFGVAGNRALSSVLGIGINIVLFAMTFEKTT
jgi:hypothetical protein